MTYHTPVCNTLPLFNGLLIRGSDQLIKCCDKCKQQRIGDLKSINNYIHISCIYVCVYS